MTRCQVVAVILGIFLCRPLTGQVLPNNEQPRGEEAAKGDQFIFEIRFISTDDQKIQQILKNTNVAVPPNENAEPFSNWKPLNANSSPAVSQTITRIDPNEPTTLAIVTDEQLRLLIERSRDDVRSNILMAPKITVLPNQVGTIEDLRRVRVAEASKALTKADQGDVFEGTKIHVRAVPLDDDAVRADAEILLVSLEDADEIRKTADGSIARAPQQIKSTFQVSSRLTAESQNLLLIPPTQEAPKTEAKRLVSLSRFRKTEQSTSTRLVIAITVRRIEMN